MGKRERSIALLISFILIVSFWISSRDYVLAVECSADGTCQERKMRLGDQKSGMYLIGASDPVGLFGYEKVAIGLSLSLILLMSAWSRGGFGSDGLRQSDVCILRLDLLSVGILCLTLLAATHSSRRFHVLSYGTHCGGTLSSAVPSAPKLVNSA